MQVHALVAHHVVALARIDVEIGLRSGGDAGFQETVGMLGNYRRVIEADDDLQAALEVGSLVDQAGLLVALGVGLRGVHIALAIHHLIPLPVDDGTAGDTHLEHVRVVGHQTDGHEAAEAPSVHAQTRGIDIVECAQEVHATHLVLHLDLPQFAERSLLEVASTVLAAAVVEDEQQVTTLGHIGLPTAAGPMPTCIHVVGMRSAIDIDHGGVLLLGVKIDGHHHAVIQVGRAVGGLDAAATVLGHGIALPGIGSGEIAVLAIVAGVHDGDVAGHVGLLITVNQVTTAGAQAAVVPALAALVDAGHLACGDIHAVEVLLDGIVSIGTDDDSMLLLVKAEHVHHHPLATGELSQLIATGVIEVQMVVAVLFAPQDELLLVPRQEGDGMLGLDILGMGLAVERGDAVASHGVI